VQLRDVGVVDRDLASRGAADGDLVAERIALADLIRGLDRDELRGPSTGAGMVTSAQTARRTRTRKR
jgi:hypothetical protein